MGKSSKKSQNQLHRNFKNENWGSCWHRCVHFLSFINASFILISLLLESLITENLAEVVKLIHIYSIVILIITFVFHASYCVCRMELSCSVWHKCAHMFSVLNFVYIFVHWYYEVITVVQDPETKAILHLIGWILGVVALCYHVIYVLSCCCVVCCAKDDYRFDPLDESFP